MTVIVPWQVWNVDFDPQVGGEQYGLRPAIVVGSPIMCEVAGRRLALVVPCTTRDRGLSWQPRILLRRPSVVMCEQVKSVSRDRLTELWPYVVPGGVRDEIRLSLHNFID